MIVYVNGDSHSAGAEAVNPHCFAEDDPLYWALGRQAHPDNLRASYGCELSNLMGAILECDAESASSNDRILRTTNQYLEQSNPKPDLVIIGWSTWEREEWFHDGVTYQVTAGGTDQVPNDLKQKYKEWVIKQNEPDVYNQKLIDIHNRIWDLHNSLDNQKIPHLFFNTYSDFENIKNLVHLGTKEYNWDDCYINPYDRAYTYYEWCLTNGFKTVSPKSYHFGADAHCAWAEFLYQNIVQKQLTS